jgi:ATP synthase protein I
MANSSFDDDELEAAQHRRLNAEEAQALRQNMPAVTAWQVVGLQAVVGVLVALAAWLLTQRPAAGWSAAYGAATVVIPAVLFARGLVRQFGRRMAGETKPAPALAGMGFFMWEAVKIIITLVMLFSASRWVADLEWLALLAGLVVTLKVYWVALLVQPKPKLVEPDGSKSLV